MPMPQYEREEEETASPGCTWAILKVFGVAALVGLGIGIIWVIAGLLHFHVLR